MLLAAEAQGDLGEDRLVADLGCGGGILGIGAACLGADHVLLVDIDPKALEVAAANVEELEVPADLLACDVLRLAARRRQTAPQVVAPAVVSTPLPGSFIESALPTRRKYEESLKLDGDERAKLEAAARRSLEAAIGAIALEDVDPERQDGKQSLSDGEMIGISEQLEASQDSIGHGQFDCVLMNPPFGTQKHSNGIDMAFLRAGLELCSSDGAVYSLHKSSTRAFIAKRAAEWGVHAKVVAELKFEIPKMYKHHRKASLDVDVDFWRVSPREPQTC